MNENSSGSTSCEGKVTQTEFRQRLKFALQSLLWKTCGEVPEGSRSALETQCPRLFRFGMKSNTSNDQLGTS